MKDFVTSYGEGTILAEQLPGPVGPHARVFSRLSNLICIRAKLLLKILLLFAEGALFV